MHSIPPRSIHEPTDGLGLFRGAHPAETSDDAARVPDDQVDDVSEGAGEVCDGRFDVVDVVLERTDAPGSGGLEVTSRLLW